MRRFFLLLTLLLLLASRITQPPAPVQDVRTVYHFYLPIVVSNLPIFGVQDETKGVYAPYYAEWTRVHIPVRWDWVDERGIEIYSRVPAIAAVHYTILGIRTAPPRYRLWETVPCSPPSPQHYGEFADFAVRMLAYTGAQAVAVWNEPDTPVGDENWLPFIGCWGLDVTAGLRYGELVQAVYTAVKAYDPDVDVIAGELAGQHVDFVVGFLTKAAGSYDYVSFHRYNWYGSPWSGIGEFASWLHTLTNKPLMLTETALMFEGNCSNPTFQTAQVDYFRWWTSNLFAWDIEAGYSYTIGGNGWRCTDLMSAGPTTPVYLEYLDLGHGGLY